MRRGHGRLLGAGMGRLTLISALFLAACWGEDPRIAEAERIADETCACNYLACAMETAAPLLETRGLEQEDYESLPDDLLERYADAVSRAELCMRRWILE